MPGSDDGAFLSGELAHRGTLSWLAGWLAIATSAKSIAFSLAIAIVVCSILILPANRKTGPYNIKLNDAVYFQRHLYSEHINEQKKEPSPVQRLSVAEAISQTAPCFHRVFPSETFYWGSRGILCSNLMHVSKILFTHKWETSLFGRQENANSKDRCKFEKKPEAFNISRKNLVFGSQRSCSNILYSFPYKAEIFAPHRLTSVGHPLGIHHTNI